MSMSIKKKKVVFKLSPEQKNECKEAFDLFDINGDNEIEYSELKVILKALGFQSNKAELQSIIRQYDFENTGKISFQDFIDLSYLNSDSEIQRQRSRRRDYPSL